MTIFSLAFVLAILAVVIYGVMRKLDDYVKSNEDSNGKRMK